jgi:hypothetical protein
MNTSTLEASRSTISCAQSETPIENENEKQEKNRILSEYVKCKRDPFFFMTRYCKTQLQDGSIRVIPPWPYIQEYVEKLSTLQDVFVEKSRQMLVSWVTMAFDLWGLLFIPGYTAFVGSRKEKLVDDGGEHSTRDSLLGKIRFMWNGLPEYMQGSVQFKQLRVTYEEQGSFIVGESANPDMGRGGTYRRATLDESARLPNGEQVFGSLRSAAPTGVALVSTPYGKSGLFPRIRFSPNYAGFDFLRLHWSLHPLRAIGLYTDEKGKLRSPWYDKQCESMTDDQIARELDINYSGAVPGRCYTEFEYDNFVTSNIRYDDAFPLLLFFDYGIDNPTFCIFAQYKDPYLDILADYERSNLVVKDHVDNIMQITRDLGVIVDRTSFQCYGDPAGENRDPSKGTSVVDEYRQHQISISSRQSSVRDRVELIKLKFKNHRIRIHPNCDRLCECLDNLRWKRDKNGEPITNEKREPNWATHGIDALEYGAVNTWPDELKAISVMSPDAVITSAADSDLRALDGFGGEERSESEFWDAR